GVWDTTLKMPASGSGWTSMGRCQAAALAGAGAADADCAAWEDGAAAAGAAGLLPAAGVGAAEPQAASAIDNSAAAAGQRGLDRFMDTPSWARVGDSSLDAQNDS
ncbi:MAG TPA: hypothetical protein VKU60_01275, partial [Chloroflexota bacterium]|nr:hypothetical protein [Chloroflexota bacterium]